VKCRACGGVVEVPILLSAVDVVDEAAPPPLPQPAPPLADPLAGLLEQDLVADARGPGAAGPLAPSSPFAPGGVRVPGAPLAGAAWPTPAKRRRRSGRNPVVAFLVDNKLLVGGLAVGLACLIALWPLSRWVLRQMRAAGHDASSAEQAAEAAGGGPTDLFPLDKVPLPDFPSRGVSRPLPEGVDVAEVRLGVCPGQPGQANRLWVYTPRGTHSPKSLPCVLIAAAGSTLYSGMALGEGDRPEHVPYAKAGFAVVAFESDGDLGNRDYPTHTEVRRAYEQFAASQAGLVNARNALEFALQKMPEVDPERIYAVGHSSAATLALLFAEHEPRLAACVAYAPATNVPEHLAGAVDELDHLVPGSREFLERSSPSAHAEQLSCPLFVFQAMDDYGMPVQTTIRFTTDLRAQGKDVTLVTVPTGGHYDSMIRQGVPQAIRWLRERSADRRPSPQTASLPASLPGAPRMTAGGAGPSTPPAPGRPSPFRAGPSKAPAALAGWGVHPDPPAEPIHVADDLVIPLRRRTSVSEMLVFPAMSSRFVAINVVDVWNVETGEPCGRLPIDLKLQFSEGVRVALSPDGRYVAGMKEMPKGTRGTVVGVWSVEEGKCVTDVRMLDAVDRPPDFIEFTGPGRFVAAFRTRSDGFQVFLASVSESRPHTEFSVETDGDERVFALSPSGAYLAAAAREGLEVYDMGSGQRAGSQPYPAGGERQCWGLAFSPDGSELAGLFDAGPSRETVSWDLADGSVREHLTAPGRWAEQVKPLPGYVGQSLEWLADGRGWLVAMRAGVERGSGRIAWHSDEPVKGRGRLVDGRKMVWLVRKPWERVVCSDVSLDGPPDFARDASSLDVPLREVWSVAPDPPAGPVRVAEKLSIAMPFEARVFGTTLFPATASPFVVLGHNGNDMGVMTLWNVETNKQVGATLTGKLGMKSKLLALSPDGQLLAGESDRPVPSAGKKEDEKDHGAYLSLWSFETGQHVSDLQVSPDSPFVNYFQFAGRDRLITALRPSGDAYEIRVWSVPDGKLQREFLINAEDRQARSMAISPSGKYLAAATDHLAIYDLSTGRPAGVRPFPGAAAADKAADKWTCHGLAFSHDGTELAGLFDVGESSKIVAWDLGDGTVTSHHTAPGTWESRVPRLRNYDGRKIEWLADKTGWLVAGSTAVERGAGKEAWKLEDPPSEPVRLFNGRTFVGLVPAGPTETLVACDVSLSQAPDLTSRAPAGPQNPFPGSPGVVGVVRLQVVEYPGSGDPATIAQQSLRNIPWADPTAVKVDTDRKEVVIGVRVMAVDTGEAKTALEQAGFKIGASMFSAMQ
jgi:WD40 repeat protein/dienelactone hydrolase